ELAGRAARPRVAVLAEDADARGRLDVDREGGVRALVDGPVERLLVDEPAAVRVADARQEEARRAVGVGREDEVRHPEHGHVLDAQLEALHDAGTADADVGPVALEAPRRLLEAAALAGREDAVDDRILRLALLLHA